jgi:chemotaxis protein MotB
MTRRRSREGHASHERWLVSYADFITLLFAFFVMMYAHSQTNQTRAHQIQQAFREALSDGRLTQALAKLIGAPGKAGAPVQAQIVALRSVPDAAPVKGERGIELLPSLQQLNEKLGKEIEAGRLEVRLERRGLVISLREATFFPSGGDTLAPSTLPVLATIASELAKYPNPIRLEGHTDSQPIHTARFRSNWELSAARGIAMLELFTRQFNIPMERVAIAGYADTAPVAANATEEGRSRNRRVDIVILNEEAQLSQPAQSRPAGH